MTLEEIKNEFKRVSLAHVDVLQFNYGETFDIPDAGTNQYPFAFLELPYLQTYDKNKTKSINFALNILIKTEPDNKEQDHQAISDADIIGDAIITRIQNENKELFFENITALSLREFSDDDVAGQRFEFLIKTGRNYCTPSSYTDVFKDC